MRALLLPLLLIIGLSSFVVAAQSVLGIDLGQEYIKAVLVKPGVPLEIVLTKDSKRKEASAIGFKPSDSSLPTRVYGGDAVNLAARFPANVFPNLKQLLGKRYGSPELETYKRRYPALTIEEGEHGRILFLEPASGKKFHVEELLAMQLRTVMRQAEEMPNGSKVKDAVFTVPAFYGAEEKSSLLLAAELAGLRTLSMITDGMAVGLNYATAKTFKTEVPEYHIVYDMGAGSTTATVLRFQGKSVKDVGRFNKTVTEVEVLGVGYDRTLGGDAFTEKILDILIDDFTANKGKNISPETLRTNGRAAAKLWREATRVRQILSANTETMGSVESLIDDIDYRSSKISRAAFEKTLDEFAFRITQPIWDAISASGLQGGLDMISTIIIHGGATRTPIVQKKLENMVGVARVSKNVNSDEAAVFGATFRGAGLSGSFRVKEIQAADGNPYVVSANFGNNERLELFPAGSPPGKETVIELPTKTTDFTLDVRHEGKMDGTMEDVVKVDIKNVNEGIQALKDDHKCEANDIITKLVVRLSPKTGIPGVIRAWVECKKLEMDIPKDEGIIDGLKDKLFGKKSSSSSESSSSSSSSDGNSKSTSTTTSNSASATPTPTLKTHVKSIKVHSTKLVPPRPNKTAILSQISLFDTHDATIRALEETRNNLEALVYRTREKILPVPDLLSSEEVTSLEESLTSAGDWLYEEGFGAPLEAVKERFSQLQQIVRPIEQRAKDIETRPKLVEQLKETLKNAEKLGLESIKSIQSWLEEKETIQSGRKAWEDVALSVTELEQKVKALETELQQVLKKKIAEEQERRRKEAAEKKRQEEEEKKKKKEEEEQRKKASEAEAQEAAEKVVEPEEQKTPKEEGDPLEKEVKVEEEKKEHPHDEL
ncbi:actin-like ATPase domain-containing protein [Ascodesmis nigricans]|uniref:Actin-like ATPase domain-containing protein n=1 Tax=Ascodesmis nigricans TaxID=341454 RepID=A0A4S2N4E8_9PEZI|nr:actin-like ATPase domain-containing protein [Ascodesmis nigricans]